MSDFAPDKKQPYTAADAPQPFPLLVTDPPKIGQFWLDARLTASASGVVYFAHAENQPTVLLLALNEGAATEAAARDRLAGEVNRMHTDAVVARGGWGQDGGRLAAKFEPELDDPVTPGDPPVAPWVALAYDGRPHALAEANRLLSTIDLSSMRPLGNQAGPGFALPFVQNAKTGKNRVWPLPWPGRHDRAGWVPIFTSWLLMLVMAGLALLIAVLIFQNTPPESPEPPVPTQQDSSSSDPSEQPESQSPDSASPDESQSAEPSSGSASPQEQSASPSDSSSHGGSPSKDPSMGASGEGSASGEAPQSQNTKL